MNAERLSQTYYNKAAQISRGPNDFEIMFSQIYGKSWQKESRIESYINMYLRLTEELSEVAEAVRFHHLYPVNFENEIADLFAWWFALVNFLRMEEPNGEVPVADVLWRAYPGHCLDCQSTPCFCLQGPVRELVSKPAPGHAQSTDVLTSLRTRVPIKLTLVRYNRVILCLPIRLHASVPTSTNSRSLTIRMAMKQGIWPSSTSRTLCGKSRTQNQTLPN